MTRREKKYDYPIRCDVRVEKTGDHCREIPKHHIDTCVFLCDRCYAAFLAKNRRNKGNFKI